MPGVSFLRLQGHDDGRPSAHSPIHRRRRDLGDPAQVESHKLARVAAEDPAMERASTTAAGHAAREVVGEVAAGAPAGEEDLSSRAGRASALAQARKVRLEPGWESRAESRLHGLQVEARIQSIYLAMDEAERMQAMRELRCHEPEKPMEMDEWSVLVAARRLEFNAAYALMAPLQRILTASEIRDPGALLNLSRERWKRALSLREQEWGAAYVSLGTAGRSHALELVRQCPLPPLQGVARDRAVVLRVAEFARLLQSEGVFNEGKILARLRSLDGLVGEGAPDGQTLRGLLLLRFAEMLAVYRLLPDEACATAFRGQSHLSDLDTLDDAAFDVRLRLTEFEAMAVYKRLGDKAGAYLALPHFRFDNPSRGQSLPRRNALIVGEFRGYFSQLSKDARYLCLDSLMDVWFLLPPGGKEAFLTLREQLLSVAINTMPAEDRTVAVTRIRNPLLLATREGERLSLGLALRRKAFEIWLRGQPRAAQLAALEEARKPERLADLSGVVRSRALDMALTEFRVFKSVLSEEDRASAWAQAQRLDRLDGCDAARLPDATLLCRTEFQAWYGALTVAKRLAEVAQLRERCEALPAAVLGGSQDTRAFGVVQAQFETLYGLLPSQRRDQALAQARQRPASEPGEGHMPARRAEFDGAYACMTDSECHAQVIKPWAALWEAGPADPAAMRFGLQLLAVEMESAARWVSPAMRDHLLAGFRTSSGLGGEEPERIKLAMRMRHTAFVALMRRLEPSTLLAVLAEARRPDALVDLNPAETCALVLARRCEMMAIYHLLPTLEQNKALTQARDALGDTLESPADFSQVGLVVSLRRGEFNASMQFMDSDAGLLNHVALLRQPGDLTGMDGPTLKRMAQRRALEIDVALTRMSPPSARAERAQAHDPAVLGDAQGPALEAALALCEAQFLFEYGQMTAEQVAAEWERACSPGSLVALGEDALARALALRGAEFEALSVRMTGLERRDRRRALRGAGAPQGLAGPEAEVAGRLREVALRALAPYRTLAERWAEEGSGPALSRL